MELTILAGKKNTMFAIGGSRDEHEAIIEACKRVHGGGCFCNYNKKRQLEFAAFAMPQVEAALAALKATA